MPSWGEGDPVGAIGRPLEVPEAGVELGLEARSAPSPINTNNTASPAAPNFHQAGKPAVLRAAVSPSGGIGGKEDSTAEICARWGAEESEEGTGAIWVAAAAA
ncbi:MAG: hypothetical protein ACKOI2_10440, partial [Actinomycetota bacterium]